MASTPASNSKRLLRAFGHETVTVVGRLVPEDVMVLYDLILRIAKYLTTTTIVKSTIINRQSVFSSYHTVQMWSL